ncbi:34802_t:CDS:2 [Racocetra persica]|uniref:34802_t:CDS:1 n=1 Tax=Racocetra persica TaxID=160502 RepID=A0ACA9RZ33_9GLOM|nr:34802_t:CDS:2 [Racocetra persica]
MSSELEVLKQLFDAERVELMCIIAETLKMTKEERMRRAVNFT